MMTGTSLRSRIRSRVCHPSRSGIETSSRTRSGGEAWSARRPDRPSSACSTLWPARSRSLTTRLRMSSSSSTTRIRASFIPSSYQRRGLFPTPRDDISSVARVLISEPHPDCRALLALVVQRVGHDPVDSGELVDDDELGLMILEPASAAGGAMAAPPPPPRGGLPHHPTSIRPPERRHGTLAPG